MELNEIRVVFAGFSTSEILALKKKLNNFGQFKIEYTVNDRTSYLVTTETEFQSSSLKVKKALQKKIPVVKKEFIEDCISKNKLIDEKMYLITKEIFQSPSNHVEDRKRPMEERLEDPESKRRKKESNIEQSKKPTAKQRKAVHVQSTGKWRTARVFISSTFRDMHGERDYLTRYVFPELQEHCQKLKVHVHPVDLRWGVTSEDTINALELCLTELDSCRPFFIGLLGNRYGWCPKKYIVPDEPRFDFLKSTPPGRSITHLEMEYGVLRDPKKAKCAFYFRDSEFFHGVPIDFKSDFQEESEKYVENLSNLKDKIKNIVPPEFIFNYPCTWRGVVDGKPMVGGLEKFGQHVLETFWKYFQEEFPIEEISQDPLVIERGYHDRFTESHSRLFVGRHNLLQKIRYFTQNNTTYPLVIVGQPGSGKTSLVSYFAYNFSREMKNTEDIFVLIHFIGAAPGSTSIRLTLSRLVQEIAIYFNFHIEKVSEEFKELQNLFVEYIKKIGTDFPTKKLVLIIDALNQLDTTSHSHTLDWLPEEFPPNVRVILSTLPGDVYDVLSRRNKEEISVEGLTSEEQKEIVRQNLWQYRKKLDPDQVKKLLEKTDAGKPLYLIVACEELRVFGVFEKVTERIQKMAGTVPKLFEEVLRRLESDYDRDMIVKTLSFLTCSRGGLLETELLQLLGSRKDKYPLPQGTWTKLYRSFQNYLRPPGESGEGVLDFFHQQLPKAVYRLYLSDKNFFKHIHSELAEFFWEQSDPNLDGMWDAGSKRGLQYVAYHHVKAKNWKALKTIMCNLGFIEAKCELGMTYDLVADYLQIAECKNEIPEDIFDEISEYQRFVMGRSHVLSHSPYLTFSMAYSLPNNSSPAKQAHYRYYQAGLESRPFLKWLNKPQTSNPCIMTLSGHEMVVRCCAISPDPSRPRIVSASDDKTLKLYDGMTGEEILTLKGHTNSVLFCNYSPNGQYIVSGGYDRVAIVWDAETGVIDRELKPFKGVITGCAFSHNGNLIAVTSRDRTVRIWRDSNLERTLESHEKVVLGCEFSPDGKYLATCSEDTSIIIWKTSDYTEYRKYKHDKSVNSVSWSFDSQKVVSASDDRKVIIWDVNTGEQCLKLSAHKDGATSAVFNSTGTCVISASHDNMIIIWDTTTGGILTSLAGHTGSVFRAMYSPNGDRIISCSFDRSVKIWEVRDKVENIGHDGRILSVKFSPDGKKIVTSSRDRTLKIWDTMTGKELAHMHGHTSNVFGACWSPDGKLICSAGRDKVLKIWDGQNGKCLHTIEGHKGGVRCCAWSPGGEHIISGSDDKSIFIWDTQNYTKCGGLFGHHKEVVCCVYSKDGNRVASCSEDGMIKIWNTKKGSFNGSYVKVATFTFHETPLKSLGFSPDNNFLISGGDDNILAVWNANNAKIIKKLLGHSEGIRACGYTVDGKWIISGATDSTVRLWNTTTNQVDCSFASEGRLCALDSSMLGFQHVFVCGDGSGVVYILLPEGLESEPQEEELID